MKASFNWLKELVALPAEVDAAGAAAALTAQGLEVEGTLACGRETSGVLVAEVLSSRPHPGADRLRLVRVRAGGREDEVVCGAPNVPGQGGRVAWAAPGATLPGGLKITPRDIRGVMSPGMLCSERELGLSEQADGILVLDAVLDARATPGADLGSALGIRDDVFEVNVTPNRPDALCHAGLARELAAHFEVPWRLREPLGAPGVRQAPATDVVIEDADLCARYLARFAFDIAVARGPLFVRLRLASCGVRAVSNVVDATNYVMLETGHPMHAFDLDRLQGDIAVRRARAGERIETLDGQDRSLTAEDVVIADAEGPVALAGVMGGRRSEVTAGTRRILLETATFAPRPVRRTARRLGLHSEASHRFERGVDANGIPDAGNRAIAMIASHAGGKVGVDVVDRYPRPIEPWRIDLRAQTLASVTGVSYAPAVAAAKLRRLGVGCEVVADHTRATIPTWRPDLRIEEDLVEEVLRMGEYGRPADPARILENAVSRPSPEASADRARDLLAAQGLHEIVSWAFVPRSALEAIARRSGGSGGAAEAVTDESLARGVLLANPISADYEVMRTSLLPGLLAAVSRNLSYGVTDPRLFEVGPVVRRPSDPDTGAPPEESVHAAAVLCGRNEGWLKPGDPLDFFDAKAVMDELLRGLGFVGAEYIRCAEVGFLHPGVSASVRQDDRGLGFVGEIDPVVARRLGVEQRVLYLEVWLDRALRDGRGSLRVVAPARFPAVVRDVSFWIAEEISAGEQRAAFAAAGEPLLRELAVLEDFRDPKYAPPGRKGMLWSMTYRAEDRSLTDEEASAAHFRVVQSLKTRAQIQIR